jgi:hypothetical protein
MPIHTFTCSCGHTWPEYYKITVDVPSIIPCPRCQIRSGVRQFPTVHTEKDFTTPILAIHRPIHSQAEAVAIQRECPDVEIVPDPECPDTLVPRFRNYRARSQYYKYKHLQDSK